MNLGNLSSNSSKIMGTTLIEDVAQKKRIEMTAMAKTSFKTKQYYWDHLGSQRRCHVASLSKTFGFRDAANKKRYITVDFDD